MLPASIYKKRRLELSKILGNSPIIIAGFEAMQQTNDASAPFVQDSNFFWLTGVSEPGWQLIINNDESILVSAAKTEIQRIFDGGLSGNEAILISGVESVVLKNESKSILKNIAEKNQEVYTVFKHPHSKYFDFALNPSLQKTRKELKTFFSEVHDCRQALAKLKAIKSPEEVDLIQRAIDISIDGFKNVYESLKNTQHEYEIEANLSYAFRAAGSQGYAYQPIVGVGKNACTLHYIDNNDPLPENGVVLIDAGAKVGGYAADITRTYAIGNPSEREKAVHHEVQKAHEAIISLIKPGYSLKKYTDDVDEIMKKALKNLNLLNAPKDYRKYFPHAISHGLGIDVHDSLGGYETFQAGMVLTVEPGIYIPEEGIGVRIEDDILVTESGNKNLSAALSTSL